MAVTLVAALRNDIAAAVLARIDAGTGPGTIELRTGAKPANPEAAATGTLLARFTLTDPAGVVAGPTLTLDFDPDIEAVASAAGDPGWARVKDSGVNTPVLNAPTTATTGGTLAAGTYFYVITATNANGETVKSNEVSQVTTGTASTVGLSWAAVTGATGYKVYRSTATGTQTLLATLGAVTSYTDTGTATTAPTPPTVNGTGNSVFDGTAGTAGADFTTNVSTVAVGQTVRLLTGTVTAPA